MTPRFDARKPGASERDVALFAIKGLSVAGMAGIRDTREGTIKARCAAFPPRNFRAKQRRMRTFIIHMAASAARRPNAEALRAALPAAEIVAAVDGAAPGRIADVAAHPGNLYRPHYPFALRPAEIGVFESHRACWRRIVAEGLDRAIIVEDDLAIDPDRFARALALLRDHAGAGMYIRLPVKQSERPARILAAAGDLRLALPRTIGLQCICQVVGRHAARRLLAATDRIDRPVDTLLQMHWVTGQPVHTLLGTGNREIAARIGGSTIQQKIPASARLRREIRRARYRAQVALRPQRP